MNRVRDEKSNVLCESDFVLEDKRNRVLGVMDDISLVVIDRGVEMIDREVKNLRVGILQLLCLES